MGIWDWVDKAVFKAIASACIIGTCAALVRAMQKREKIKPFIVRLLSGLIISGFIGYLFGASDLPKYVFGPMCFSAGWLGAEAGTLISRIGTSYIKKAIEKDADEHKSVD